MSAASFKNSNRVACFSFAMFSATYAWVIAFSYGVLGVGVLEFIAGFGSTLAVLMGLCTMNAVLAICAWRFSRLSPTSRQFTIWSTAAISGIYVLLFAWDCYQLSRGPDPLVGYFPLPITLLALLAYVLNTYLLARASRVL